MLLRTVIAIAGVSLLSACTFHVFGDDNPEEAASEVQPRPVPLEVPPDLTRPAVSTQYAIPAPKEAAAPATGTALAAPIAERDVESRLKELQTLRDKGLITDAELQERRKAVLESL